MASLRRGARAVGERAEPSSLPEEEIGRQERRRAYWAAEYLTSPGKKQTRFNLNKTRLNLLHGYRECKVTQTAAPSHLRKLRARTRHNRTNRSRASEAKER